MSVHSRGLAAMLLSLCALAAVPAAAQTGPADPNAASAASSPEARIDPKILAQVFLSDGRPDLACDLLEVVFGKETTEPDVLMMLGQCSRELERYDAAIGYYQRVAALEPQAARPRLELGAIYLRLGQADRARAEFAAAAKLDSAGEAASAINQLAQALGAVGDPAAVARTLPKRWQARLFAGIVHDTNINAGPSSSTAAAVIGGAPVTLRLTEDSQPQDSWGATASADLRYLHPLSERFALLAQGALAKTDYFDSSDFGTDSAAASLALIYRQPGLTVSLQPNVRFVRQENHLDESTYGATLRLTRQLTGRLAATGSAGYVYREVPNDDARDRHGPFGSAGLSYRFDNGITVGGEYLVEREQAEDDIFSRTIHGPFVYASASPVEGVRVAASYRYAHVEHDERQAIFPETREDDQHILGLAVDWDISQWTMPGLGLRGQYSYIDNGSTVDINEYDRHFAVIGVSWRF